MRSIVGVMCLALVAGCGDGSESDEKSADASTERGHQGDKRDQGDQNAPALREVPCTDASFMALMLFDEPATGKIREEGTGGDFVTFIDTTGGGLTATESYIYARFTDKGLQKLDLSDEDAFESSSWDIALRRYVIRLNSGVSGPGDVKAGRTAPMTQFADVTKVPDNLELRTEEYFTEGSCDFVSDGSGISGSPATALASFWSYKSCVQMTKNVYVLALPKGRHVKLEVLAYYSLENQRTCDATGQVPMPSGAGNLRVRWAFLD